MMMSQRSCLSSEVCIQINSKKYRKSDLEHFPSPKRNASASFIASPLPKKQTNSFSLFWNECTYQVFFFYCRFFINLTYASPWVVTNVWSCVSSTTPNVFLYQQMFVYQMLSLLLNAGQHNNRLLKVVRLPEGFIYQEGFVCNMLVLTYQMLVYSLQADRLGQTFQRVDDRFIW